MVGRLEKLESRLRNLAADAEGLADEVARIRTNAPSAGQEHKRILEHFQTAWLARYGTKYVVAGVKDASVVKRLLRDLSADEIATAMDRYLRSADPFYVQARHALALFALNINKFTVSERASYQLRPQPVGCRHHPPCVSDQAHTARSQRELRT